MGRLSSHSKNNYSVRSNFGAQQYEKFVNELSDSCSDLNDLMQLISTHSSSTSIQHQQQHPPHLLYCCQHCGHTQELQNSDLTTSIPLNHQSNTQLKEIEHHLSSLNSFSEMNAAMNQPCQTASLADSDNVINTQIVNPQNDERSHCSVELNSFTLAADKPHLMKRIAMGITGRRPIDDDSWPLVNDPRFCASNKSDAAIKRNHLYNTAASATIPVHHLGVANTETQQEQHNNKMLVKSSTEVPTFGLDGISNKHKLLPSTCKEGTLTLNPKDECLLKMAPWFQAGIPREIALEILALQPIGSFIVRESTTKSGCFALSLRVPKGYQTGGIAHYLIVQTNKGYKIKGFTKDFPTLMSLITHHSVMPELLPCPLSLSRYKSNGIQCDKHDFVDVDVDPSCRVLDGLRKMMSDASV